MQAKNSTNYKMYKFNPTVQRVEGDGDKRAVERVCITSFDITSMCSGVAEFNMLKRSGGLSKAAKERTLAHCTDRSRTASELAIWPGSVVIEKGNLVV